jgi:hypothetical protein
MPRRNIPVRNPVAQSPLLRKGGPHVKSKSGQRTRSRLSTNSAMDEWLDEQGENNNQEQENGEQQLPDFLCVFIYSAISIKTRIPIRHTFKPLN